ncbi:TetR family transcriptional regulator [Brachybacterium sp. AOP42-E1-35]|uniref:TetR family transcriptional regulator n=1 Tax=Brachybacterium sp. AOP42-E1-35 TaxID=3457664 RepID=UPI003FE52411
MAQQKRARATRESIIRAGAVVFGRQHFDSVRIADLLRESGVTQGGFYFHFTGKKQVAEELIRRQEQAFVELRDRLAVRAPDDPVHTILLFMTQAAMLLRDDHVARAGMRLVLQAAEHFPDVAYMPHPDWIELIEGVLNAAIGNGTVRPDIDAPTTARTLIYLFIGTQVSSYITDDWQVLPETIETILSATLRNLATPTRLDPPR